MGQPKSRFVDLLIKKGLITPEQFDEAVTKQKADGGKINQLLVSLGFIEEDLLLSTLAEQLQIPLIDLKKFPLNINLSHQLPEATAKRYRAILLEETDNGLLVGMVDPQDIIALDELARVLHRPIHAALLRESELLAALEMVYRHTEEISTYAKALSEEVAENYFDVSELTNIQEAQDVPVAKLIESLFREAINLHASDIHIEPDENVLRIRQRVDGVLQESVMPETHIAPALALRLKLMAGLQIAEKRLPQDGRFSIRVNEKNIDVRLSTMPVQYGESVVMRLLDRHSMSLDLDKLGISDNILKIFKRLLKLPNGMVLITGPTGSGKTSTLYGMLNDLNKSSAKIITVEDPVEYRLPRINQVQVNPQIGLDFSQVLRSALRQDPDVLMVGEIRDKETASIALRAAMTGHFVLATLHTNDAISSAMRLIEMQGEGYMVAAALRAVIAQRLLRKVCERCAKEHHLSPNEKRWADIALGQPATEGRFRMGVGCSHCHHTGYRGRVPVFELFEVDDSIANALRNNSPNEFTVAVRNHGYITLAQYAMALAQQGITSLQEVLRVAVGMEEEIMISTEENALQPQQITLST